jgi:predicted lipoprotein with Yx(FWY)xxD motif
MRKPFEATLLIAAAALICAPAMAAPAQKLEAKQSRQYGSYLTDGQGRSLYMFEADKQGGGQSACKDQCANVWMPAEGSAKPQTGRQVNASEIGTITRSDGKTQLSYNGWPLYYYAPDQRAGQTKGQGINSFGAEWYLLSPKGQKIEKGAG